jgi:hypothetical protein
MYVLCSELAAVATVYQRQLSSILHSGKWAHEEIVINIRNANQSLGTFACEHISDRNKSFVRKMFYLVVFIFAQNSFPAISIKTLPVSHELVRNITTESIYDRTAHPGDLLVAGDNLVFI